MGTIYLNEEAYGGGGGGQRTVTNIWNYINDNNGNVLFGTYTKTLHDDISNYDEIIVEVMSSSGDSGNWNATSFFKYDVLALSLAKNPYHFSLNTYDQRSSSFNMTGNVIQKVVDNQANINGLVNVYGVKY